MGSGSDHGPLPSLPPAPAGWYVLRRDDYSLKNKPQIGKVYGSVCCEGNVADPDKSDDVSCCSQISYRCSYAINQLADKLVKAVGSDPQAEAAPRHLTFL